MGLSAANRGCSRASGRVAANLVESELFWLHEQTGWRTAKFRPLPLSSARCLSHDVTNRTESQGLRTLATAWKARLAHVDVVFLACGHYRRGRPARSPMDGRSGDA
jgi:hypothetical protein